jgi:tight adherence protein B
MLANLSTQTLAIAFLVTVSIGGGIWVFIYPLMSGERNAERRKASVTQADPTVRASSVRVNQKARREHVEETLKELDEKRKKSKSWHKPDSNGRSGSSSCSVSVWASRPACSAC